MLYEVITFAGDDNYPAFYAVNSVFVTTDKVYIPDSFAKAVYIYNREEVINP